MRHSSYPRLDPMFLERWSPRAFSPEPLSEEEIHTLLEAARWSPSCYNEQPWYFVVADRTEDRERFCSILTEYNQSWAQQAPLLLILFSRQHFAHGDRPNAWADFDAGAAWLALSLQANRLGYHTHAMAGFDHRRAYEVCSMDVEKYRAICVIAVGRRAPADSLPDGLRNREQPNDRLPLGEIFSVGRAE